MKLQELLETTNTVPFTTSTTHMATYDDMMKDPQYFKEKKGKVFTITHMSPNEYIDQAYRAFKQQGALEPWQDMSDLHKSRSSKLVDKYAEKMKSGEKFPMVVLDFSSQYGFRGGKQKSFSQEGLHRAMAAKKLGVQKVPVMIVDDA